MIIIASNAGGAWSPIGDVTLLCSGSVVKVTAANIIYFDYCPFHGLFNRTYDLYFFPP